MRVIVAMSLAVCAALATSAGAATLLTAPADSVGYAIGRDLAGRVAPNADLELNVVPSGTLLESLRTLRRANGVRLAIVPADVYQAAQSDPALADLVRSLRAVLPLHTEEIHFVVRADSTYKWLDDIRDARINVGAPGTSTETTAANVYRLMFGVPLQPRNTSHLPDDEALVKLVTDRSVDVVTIVAGQPAKLLAEMKPEARSFVRLLRYDPREPSSAALLSAYRPGALRAESYPNLIDDDLPALAVPSILMTFEPQSRSGRDALVRFARSLCRNFTALESRGQRKWREVRLMLPDLGPVLSYYAPTQNELYGCIAERAANS